MTDAIVTVNVAQTMDEIHEGLQNVLSGRPDLSEAVELVWQHSEALEAVIFGLAAGIAEVQASHDIVEQQRNQAADLVGRLRYFLTRAPEHERERLASCLAEIGNGDAGTIQRGLDYLGGNRSADGSRFAELDVIRALTRLGEMVEEKNSTGRSA
jgi:hypothetical protein